MLYSPKHADLVLMSEPLKLQEGVPFPLCAFTCKNCCCLLSKPETCQVRLLAKKLHFCSPLESVQQRGSLPCSFGGKTLWCKVLTPDLRPSWYSRRKVMPEGSSCLRVGPLDTEECCPGSWRALSLSFSFPSCVVHRKRGSWAVPCLASWWLAGSSSGSHRGWELVGITFEL